jgi:protein-tyrosine phosphatase
MSSGDPGDALQMARQSEFEIAIICTGNRFRSPLVEALLRRATDGLRVRVHSFGTLELGPAPALPQAFAAAGRLGIDLSAHRARAIRQGRLAEADLVLGFERAHVVRAVAEAGARPERTFTLPELVPLLEQGYSVDLEHPLARARELVAQAHRIRSQPGLPRAAELADPLGKPHRFFRETETTLADLTTRLAELLFTVPESSEEAPALGA